MKNKEIKIIMVIITIIVLVIVMAMALLTLITSLLMKNDKLDAQNASFVNAFISMDKETMKTMIHPDYIGILNDIDNKYTKLMNSSAALNGSLDKLKIQSRRDALYDSHYNGKTSESIYDAVIGNTSYEITIRTVQNNKGYGIIYFDIKKG